MDTTLIIVDIVFAVIILAVIIHAVMSAGRNRENDGDDMKKELEDHYDRQMSGLKSELNGSMNNSIVTLGQLLSDSQKHNQDTLNELVASKLGIIEKGLSDIREENSRKLDEIRGTVDEKLNETLNKRINESFRNVSDQLEKVYRGLGEMKNLATDVGGLKQVLSGVKTRGILGEIQLAAILSEILTPEQYDTEVPTIPGSSERVEFAVKLPGTDGSMVYLPIDSKFPGERYSQLLDAYDEGDKEAINQAKKALANELRLEAKKIHDKYVEPPYTTNFGIMFLPFEGLYAEAVNMDMVETLQREYHINVAGPSTTAALLNSLQMGFKTLAIQKRSNEVWKVLGEVKSEFGKFEDALKKMQGHLNQTSNDLDALINTRTNMMNRKLKSVENLQTEDVAGLETE